MSRIVNVVALVAVVSGLAFAVSSFADVNADGQTSLGERSADGTLLAARYHMRGRSTNFFRRSPSESRSYRDNRYYRGRAVTPADVKGKPAKAEKDKVAARYHLRGRTKSFFQRGLAARYHLRGRTTNFFQRGLAARYHLRGRTTNFFQRDIC